MKMNRLLSLLLFIQLLPFLRASELELKTVFLPLYIEHGMVGESAEAVHSNPRGVSFVSRGAQPETTLSFLMSAYIPHHDTTWSKVGDSNLISLCGITLSYTSRKVEGAVSKLEITLDLASFKLPESVRMKEEEVIELIRQSVALNFPTASLVIKTKGEQDDTAQPAIRPESKAEGSDKPQPDSERRSR